MSNGNKIVKTIHRFKTSADNSFQFVLDAAKEYNNTIKKIDGLFQKYGLSYELEARIGSRYADIVIDAEDAKKALDLTTKKMIEDLEARKLSVQLEINPFVSAYVQADYKYNELNDQMKKIASVMASNLDAETLSGFKTDADLKNYIQNNIISPLFNSSKDIQTAFSKITDWQEQLKNNEITYEEFAENIQGIFNSLVAGITDTTARANFESIFKAAFGDPADDAQTFADVVNILIENYAKFTTIC